MRLSARPPTLALLRAHLAALCDRHRIEIRTWPRMSIKKCSANFVLRSIEVPPITTPELYAAALHEIAHLCAGPWRGEAIDELAAWTWTREHALLWTLPMDNLARHSLKTYA